MDLDLYRCTLHIIHRGCRILVTIRLDKLFNTTWWPYLDNERLVKQLMYIMLNIGTWCYQMIYSLVQQYVFFAVSCFWFIAFINGCLPYLGQEWIQDNTSSARVVLSLIPQQHRHVNSRHLWSDWLVLLSSKRAILCDEMTTRVWVREREEWGSVLVVWSRQKITLILVSFRRKLSYPLILLIQLMSFAYPIVVFQLWLRCMKILWCPLCKCQRAVILWWVSAAQYMDTIQQC